MKSLLINFVYYIVRIMNIVVWVYVILSWVGGSNRKLASIYYKLSEILEPLIGPLRRLLRPITMRTGLDFSPYALVLIMGFLYRIIVRIIIAL